MIPVIKTYEFVFVLLEEKRAKRPRGHSPQNPSTPAPPVAAPVTRGVSITVPPRNSVGPQQPIPFSREPKARREALAKQLPLQEGRKVAFHPPNSSKTADSANGGKDEEWILAVVTKCINQDKNRFVVSYSARVHFSHLAIAMRCRILSHRKMANLDSKYTSEINRYSESIFGHIDATTQHFVLLSLFPTRTRHQIAQNT